MICPTCDDAVPSWEMCSGCHQCLECCNCDDEAVGEEDDLFSRSELGIDPEEDEYEYERRQRG